MKIKMVVLLPLFFLCSAGNIFAQTEETPPVENINAYRYWMTAGLGFSETHYAYTHLSYQFSIDNNFYKAEYLNRGWDILGGPGLEVVNVAIGKRYTSRFFEASGFAGPAYLFGITGTGEGYVHTVGIQANVQLVFKPVEEIGLGFNLFGNFNPEKSFGGIGFIINIGNGL